MSFIGDFTARMRGAFGGFGGNAFDGGRTDTQETAGWNAPRVHMDQVFQSQGRTIVDRAEDLDRNSSWINGALDRGVESVIGNGLQLLPRPIYDLLGKDIKWSTKWSRLTRARYRAWSEDPMFRCDAKMRFNFGTLQRLAYLNFRRGGEALAEIRSDARGASNPLNVLLIDPKRLKNPLLVGDNDDLIRNGIEHSAAGIPIAGHILKRHPDDVRVNLEPNETVRVPFRSATGTPKLIHVINPRYIEQSRGFSQLVESMVPAKMLDRYDRAVINRALVETLMGFFIESGYDPKDLQGMIAPGSSAGDGGDFENYAGWRQDNPVQAIGEMFMRHLVPGEKVVNVPPVTPGSNYPDFRKGKISEIAASHGLSYAQVSADWSDINYSSARAMLNEVWRRVEQEREYFATHFCTPIYVAWLEQEVAMGKIKLPGGSTKFYGEMTAVTKARWIGPSRGTVDPLKEANARNLEEAAFRKSPQEHILEDGGDYIEILDEIKEFRDGVDERKLDPPNYNVKADASGESADGGSGGGNSADRDNDGVANEADKKKVKPKGGPAQ